MGISRSPPNETGDNKTKHGRNSAQKKPLNRNDNHCYDSAMNGYTISAIILTLAVFIGYINHKFIRLQMTIAIMVGSMLLSVVLIAGKSFGLHDLAGQAATILKDLDFRSLLLNGMLSFLLFAGAFTVDFDILKDQRWEVGVLATISTIVSCLIIGFSTYYLLPLIGIHLKMIYCFLFGALISPTDPIAVLATFKELGAPKKLEVCVSGESLFNDGVGIVMFTTLIEFASGHHAITAASVSLLFLQQAVGGVVYGLVIAWGISKLIQSIDSTKLAILLTLVIVTGCYALALKINISGALAMVVAGIYIGHEARSNKYGAHIHDIMDVFWELIDEILNAVLFLLIGFELLAVHIHGNEYWAMLFSIPFVLLVRLATVAIPMKYFSFKRNPPAYAISILTWGGLRGGLAVALALSLPASPERNFILAMTYAIVAFAVIVQGISIRPLVRRSKQHH